MHKPKLARYCTRWVGGYLLERGRYREAEPLLKDSVLLAEQQYGPDHCEQTISLCNLSAKISLYALTMTLPVMPVSCCQGHVPIPIELPNHPIIHAHRAFKLI